MPVDAQFHRGPAPVGHHQVPLTILPVTAAVDRRRARNRARSADTKCLPGGGPALRRQRPGLDVPGKTCCCRSSKTQLPSRGRCHSAVESTWPPRRVCSNITLPARGYADAAAQHESPAHQPVGELRSRKFGRSRGGIVGRYSSPSARSGIKLSPVEADVQSDGIHQSLEFRPQIRRLGGSAAALSVPAERWLPAAHPEEKRREVTEEREERKIKASRLFFIFLPACFGPLWATGIVLRLGPYGRLSPPMTHLRKSCFFSSTTKAPVASRAIGCPRFPGRRLGPAGNPVSANPRNTRPRPPAP